MGPLCPLYFYLLTLLALQTYQWEIVTKVLSGPGHKSAGVCGRGESSVNRAGLMHETIINV